MQRIKVAFKVLQTHRRTKHSFEYNQAQSQSARALQAGEGEVWVGQGSAARVSGSDRLRFGRSYRGLAAWVLWGTLGAPPLPPGQQSPMVCTFAVPSPYLHNRNAWAAADMMGAIIVFSKYSRSYVASLAWPGRRTIFGSPKGSSCALAGFEVPRVQNPRAVVLNLILMLARIACKCS